MHSWIFRRRDDLARAYGLAGARPEDRARGTARAKPAPPRARTRGRRVALRDLRRYVLVPAERRAG